MIRILLIALVISLPFGAYAQEPSLCSAVENRGEGHWPIPEYRFNESEVERPRLAPEPPSKQGNNRRLREHRKRSNNRRGLPFETVCGERQELRCGILQVHRTGSICPSLMAHLTSQPSPTR